jgi:tetratricopeptide (TPR) repeat protein
MTPEPRLAAHIVAEATPAEMAQQWQKIEARIAPRKLRRPWLPLALAGTAAALVAIVLAHRATPERAFTSSATSLPVALADGSRLVLAPRSQVNLLGQHKDEVRLRLLRGSARFDVRHDPGRRFQVEAADLDVVVTGTAFSVAIEGREGTARVAVERGEVEVHPHGEARLLARLHAGESWPERPAPPPALASAPAEPVAPAAAAAPAPRRQAPSDPRLLLEQANAARRSGDVQQAAALLEALRVRHPRDPRAALATFELGRLRLDALGDLPGAVQALQQSIALAPAGVFREDAEACLATAYARMRDRPRCEQARQVYLGRYPAGTHAAEVTALKCAER